MFYQFIETPQTHTQTKTEKVHKQPEYHFLNRNTQFPPTPKIDWHNIKAVKTRSREIIFSFHFILSNLVINYQPNFTIINLDSLSLTLSLPISLYLSLSLTLFIVFYMFLKNLGFHLYQLSDHWTPIPWYLFLKLGVPISSSCGGGGSSLAGPYSYGVLTLQESSNLN